MIPYAIDAVTVNRPAAAAAAAAAATQCLNCGKRSGGTLASEQGTEGVEGERSGEGVSPSLAD